jgi:hypothetical protein
MNKFNRIGSSVLLCGLILLLCGCENTWHPKRQIETPEERRCVVEQEARIMSNVPKTLSGHDQDWDDAIKAAHNVAVESCCKTRQYEYDRAMFSHIFWTGRMREVQ